MAKKTLRAVTAGQACVQLVLLAWQASPVLLLGMEQHPAAYILPPLGICCVSAGSLGITRAGGQGKLMLQLFQFLSAALAVGVRPPSPPTPVPPFPPPPSQPPVLPSLGRSRSPWVPPPMLQALILAPPAAAPERGVRLRCPDRGLRPARPGGGRLPGLAHGPRCACLCPRAPACRGGAGLLRGGAPGRRGVPCIAAPRAAHHETGVGRGSAHSICTYIAASAMALIVIQRVGKILAERRRVGGAPRLTPSGAAARRWARAASTPSSGARCCRPGGGSAPRPGRRRTPPPPPRGAGVPPGGSPVTRGRSGCPRSR